MGTRRLPRPGALRDRGNPRARWEAAAPLPPPDPAVLKEAFSWSASAVRKTATVSVEGNAYSVDPFLAGRKVELVFDPFDMTRMDVYWQGRKAGTAVPQVIAGTPTPRPRRTRTPRPPP